MRCEKFRVHGLIFLCLFFTHCLLAQHAGQSYRLHLRNGEIAPQANFVISKNHASRKSAIEASDGRLVIVQFFDIPDKPTVQELQLAGLTLLDYVPENAYTAFIQPDFKTDIEGARKIRSIVELTVAQKMDPALLSGNIPAHASNVAGKVDVRLSYPRIMTFDQVKSQLAQQQIELLSTSMDAYQFIELRVDKNKLTKLAALPWIQYLEAVPAPVTPLNDKSQAGTRANVVRSQLGSGYKLNGEGVVIGVGDRGNPDDHVDVSVNMLDFTQPENYWHGLHVSGTIAGAGLVDERYVGYAPKARMLMRENTSIWEQAPMLVRDYGMVLTNNSYASSNGNDCNGFGAYNSESHFLDRQAGELTNLLHVFAGGNSGNASPCFGLPPGFGNILGGKASSKNTLTIGETGLTGLIDKSSSKGPVADGRMKPDLTAPGTDVYSTTPGNNYQNATGTSMAAPAVTGGAALLYQRYRQKYAQETPLAALIKALLCNGATDKGLAGPDFSYGFGEMNLLRSVTMLDKGNFIKGVAVHQQQNTHQIQVPADTRKMKIMIYWNDAPASALSGSRALVNNLDLRVIRPGGLEELPLVLNPANPQLPAVPGVDFLNNVEQVVIDRPGAGVYTLNVSGTKIPSGSQEYFIVYDIVSEGTTLTYPMGGERLTNGDVVNIQWDGEGNPGSTYAVSFSADNGSNWTVLNAAVGNGMNQLSWTIPNVSTTKAKIRIVESTTGEARESDAFAILGVPVVTLSPIQCEGYAAIQWNAVPQVSGYEVMIQRGNEMRVFASTSALNYTLSGLSKDSTYVIAVRALHNGVAGRRSLAVTRKPDSGTCAGTISDLDLAVDAVLSPSQSGRLFTSKALTQDETLKIRIKNLDDEPLQQSFHVGYAIGGADAPVYWETVNIGIAAQRTLDYTFVKKLDLHAIGTYPMKVFVKLDGDAVAQNNTKQITVRQLANQVLTLPYLEDFESLENVEHVSAFIGFNGATQFDFVPQTPGAHLKNKTGNAYSGKGNVTLAASAWAGGPYESRLEGTFNLSAYDRDRDEVRLTFRYRKHGVGAEQDGVYIRGSEADEWILAFDYRSVQNLQADKDFIKAVVEVSDLLKKNGQHFSPTFQIRWSQAVSKPAPADGYAIDDVALVILQSDVALKDLQNIDVASACQVGTMNNFTVAVRNNGTDDVYNVPFFIQMDNETVVQQSIPVVRHGEEILFPFSFSSNLKEPGNHRLKVWVDKSFDNNPANNTVESQMVTAPVISSFPYLENFETGADGWLSANGDPVWQYGDQTSAKFAGAASGTKAFKTDLSNVPAEQEFSYLYSPCFNVKGLNSPKLSFSMALDLEQCGTEGCAIAYVEYNRGNGWARLGTGTQGKNWYNASEGGQGRWTGGANKIWHVATTQLPLNSEFIRFRFVIKSKASSAREGLAIDDIHIYDGELPVYEGPQTEDPIRVANVRGNEWFSFSYDGAVMVSVNPMGQNLGTVSVNSYTNTNAVRTTKGQYYLDKSFTVASSNTFSNPITMRLFISDAHVERLINVTNQTNIVKPSSAYELAVTKYSGTSQDGSLANNAETGWTFFPGTTVKKVPYDRGYYLEFQTSSLSEFWLAKNLIEVDKPLPVELVSFSVKPVQSADGTRSATLEWKTAAEKDFSHFEIEYAAGREDLLLNRFGTVGSVSGKTAQGSKYQFVHRVDEARDEVYYRLKMVDLDGSEKLSVIRVVTFERLQQARVYPNPTRGSIHVDYEGSAGQFARFTLTDLLGRTVLTAKVKTSGQVQTQELDITSSAIPAGVYFLKLNVSGEERVFKIVKE